jgi:hypothetical protein
VAEFWNPTGCQWPSAEAAAGQALQDEPGVGHDPGDGLAGDDPGVPAARSRAENEAANRSTSASGPNWHMPWATIPSPGVAVYPAAVQRGYRRAAQLRLGHVEPRVAAGAGKPVRLDCQSSRTGHRGRRAGQGLPGVAGARRFLRPRPRAASRRPRRPGLGTPRGSLSTLGSGLVAGPGLSAQRASTGSARATTRTVREHHPEPPEGKHGDTDVD